jgi:hypothetical protein
MFNIDATFFLIILHPRLAESKDTEPIDTERWLYNTSLKKSIYDTLILCK